MRALLTCAFGTRLDPDELLAGVDAQGVAGARLVVGDEGLTLVNKSDLYQRALREKLPCVAPLP